MRGLILALAVIAGGLFASTPASAEQIIVDVKKTFSSLDEYQQCQAESYSGSECQKMLDEWLKTHPDDWGKAAEMVRMNQNAHVAMPYFATALEKQQAGCDHSGLAQVTTSTLALPPAGNETKIAAAWDVVVNRCFKELEAPVKAELTNPYVFKNICKGMAERQALSDLQQKKCDALK